jgi:hypothetical protein
LEFKLAAAGRRKISCRRSFGQFSFENDRAARLKRIDYLTPK